MAVSFLSPAASVWTRTVLPPSDGGHDVAGDPGLGDRVLGLLLVAAGVGDTGDPVLGTAAELDAEVQPAGEDAHEGEGDEDAGDAYQVFWRPMKSIDRLPV